MAKYFLDTEFIENGSTIDLVSIGIVADDGRQLHLGNRSCDFNAADGWVRKNVLKPMGVEFEGPNKSVPMVSIDSFWKTKEFIKHDVASFFGAKPLTDDTPQPEIWADYGSYDWVVFCQLFGKMIDLPTGFPMHINDIQQEARRLGLSEDDLPKQEAGAHNALEDAKHVQVLWQFLYLQRRA